MGMMDDSDTDSVATIACVDLDQSHLKSPQPYLNESSGNGIVMHLVGQRMMLHL